MGSDHSKTERDDEAARNRAREAWIESTLRSYLKACKQWREDPQGSMRLLRDVLEGWTHAIVVARDRSFAPYEDSRLHTWPMAKAFPIALRCVSRAREQSASALKRQSDQASHNVGEDQQTTQRIAQAALIACADLIECLYADIVVAPLPAELHQALADLHGATRAGASPIAPSKGGRRRSPVARTAILMVAVVLAVVVIALSVGAGRPWSSSDRERLDAYVKAYAQALTSRDVERIVRLHVFPARRFFLQKNYSEAKVRAAYTQWYADHREVRPIELKECQVMPSSAPGELVGLCNAFAESPSTPVGTCLVFDRDGLLVSRTELLTFRSCPPPP